MCVEEWYELTHFKRMILYYLWMARVEAERWIRTVLRESRREMMAAGSRVVARLNYAYFESITDRICCGLNVGWREREEIRRTPRSWAWATGRMDLPFREKAKMVRWTNLVTKEEGYWELDLMSSLSIRDPRGGVGYSGGYMSLELGEVQAGDINLGVLEV